MILARTLVAALVAIFLTSSAQARESVPIIDHASILLSRPDGRTLTRDMVRDAIIRGAAVRSWSTAPGGDGVLVATIVVRGKHTVVVEIPFAADRFGVRYKSSVNMNHAMRDGRPVIHPNYNRWVLNLIDAIRNETMRN